MKHFASASFWKSYEALPDNIKRQADACFELIKTSPSHPSLHFKKIGRFRSVRISLSFRALAVEVDKELLWFWIGTHDEYKKILKD